MLRWANLFKGFCGSELWGMRVCCLVYVDIAETRLFGDCWIVVPALNTNNMCCRRI